MPWHVLAWMPWHVLAWMPSVSLLAYIAEGIKE